MKEIDGNRSVSRRTVLLAGAATLPAVAGCTGVDQSLARDETPVVGDGTRGTPDGTGTESPTVTPEDATGDHRSYTSWLYAPRVIDEEHYFFLYRQPARIAEHRVELGEDRYEREARYDKLELLGVDFEDVDELIDHVLEYVFIGSFDVGAIVDTLLDEGFYDRRTYEGFEVFVGDDDELGAERYRGVGVSDTSIIFVNEKPNMAADEHVEAFIDTGRGEVERYVDTSEEFELLVTHLGAGAFLAGRTLDRVDTTDVEEGVFEGITALGHHYRLEGTTSTFRRPIVFEDESDVDVAGIEEFFDVTDGRSPVLQHHEDVIISQEGRVVLVDSTLRTEHVLPP